MIQQVERVVLPLQEAELSLQGFLLEMQLVASGVVVLSLRFFLLGFDSLKLEGAVSQGEGQVEGYCLKVLVSFMINNKIVLDIDLGPEGGELWIDNSAILRCLRHLGLLEAHALQGGINLRLDSRLLQDRSQGRRKDLRSIRRGHYLWRNLYKLVLPDVDVVFIASI